jgi:DNA invertase Pin-like site-specific DNA recombinase
VSEADSDSRGSRRYLPWAPEGHAVKPYAVYIRRSMKREGDADISDEAQEAASRTRIPTGAPVRIYSDSGGHNSGFSVDRPSYQQMLVDMRRGELAGIAAYDSSRLNRNAENALALLRECQARAVALLVSESMRPSDLFEPDGELSYGLKAIVDQHYRSQQSKRVRNLMQAAFESGRQRGHDPFGYGSIRDEYGRIIQPRRLAIVPAEAEVVRRVFTDLATIPLSDIADSLNREGIRHRTGNPWTTSTIKDLWRRRDVYRGYVVRKRSLDVRPGTHEAILDEVIYQEAVAGVEARKRRKGKGPGGRKREYVLRGLVYCSCGARMRGQARVSRGRDWRYYTCPVAEERSAVFGPDGMPLICPARSIPADEAEAAVLAAMSQLSLPDDAIREAREELRRRLRAPASSVATRSVPDFGSGSRTCVSSTSGATSVTSSTGPNGRMPRPSSRACPTTTSWSSSTASARSSCPWPRTSNAPRRHSCTSSSATW